MCQVGTDLTLIKKSMTLTLTTFLNQYHLFFLNFILLGSQQFIGCFTAYLSSSNGRRIEEGKRGWRSQSLFYTSHKLLTAPIPAS